MLVDFVLDIFAGVLHCMSVVLFGVQKMLIAEIASSQDVSCSLFF